MRANTALTPKLDGRTFCLAAGIFSLVDKTLVTQSGNRPQSDLFFNAFIYYFCSPKRVVLQYFYNIKEKDYENYSSLFTYQASLHQ